MVNINFIYNSCCSIVWEFVNVKVENVQYTYLDIQPLQK